MLMTWVLAGVVTLAAAPSAPATNDAMGTLGRRLAANGRGEVSFDRLAPDPFGGESIKISGRLALEPPDRAELRFPATGERLTLRTEGGEWLQPELQQVLTFQRRHASSALRWWRAVLGADSESLVRRQVGERDWVLVAPAHEGDPADSVRVRLSAQGLPERLEVHEGADTPSVYTFGTWKFSRGRGATAFVVEAPKGFAVVPAP
jgi:hypothetical protein